MANDGDRGAFTADIPDAAIAAALAAVERRPGSAEPRPEAACGGPGAPSAAPADGQAPLGEAERLRLELEESQARARQVYEQLRDEHDRLLRAAADLENYKKRAAREREEVLRHGNERLVKELLPALDSLDRALAAAPAGDPVAEGVELTRRLLLDALGRFGVKAFAAHGEAFDPRFHEALMTVESAAHAPGTVVEEQQRGYFLHDRLLRPAAVVVSAAPAGGADEAAPDPAGGPAGREP